MYQMPAFYFIFHLLQGIKLKIKYSNRDVPLLSAAELGLS